MLLPSWGWLSQSHQKLSWTLCLCWANWRQTAYCLMCFGRWNIIYCCSSVSRLYPTLCDPMDHSMLGFPVLHHLSEFAQTHVHWVDGAIQPSHPLLPPSPPALHLSQHQGLLKREEPWWKVQQHRESGMINGTQEAVALGSPIADETSAKTWREFSWAALKYGYYWQKPKILWLS